MRSMSFMGKKPAVVSGGLGGLVDAHPVNMTVRMVSGGLFTAGCLNGEKTAVILGDDLPSVAGGRDDLQVIVADDADGFHGLSFG